MTFHVGRKAKQSGKHHFVRQGKTDYGAKLNKNIKGTAAISEKAGGTHTPQLPVNEAVTSERFSMRFHCCAAEQAG